MSILEHYLDLLTDPAHSLVEFTFVLVDVLIIDYVRRRLRDHFHRDIAEEHSRIDAEHGITPEMHAHPQVTLREDGTAWIGNVRVLTEEASRG